MTVRGRRRLLLGATALMLAVGFWACARPGSPEGGQVPDIPPLVTSTRPDTLAVVDPFTSPVRFEFDVPMSERPATGQLRDAVVVSPRTGSVSVRHRGDRYEVSMEGGFQEGQIYRVTLLPVLQDRFQNRMAEPFDLFFSTGPEFEPNLVAGLVMDRLTGEEVEGARVDAIPEGDRPGHSTVTDSTGVFAFPFLPSGRYELVAYEDRNRNREPDFEEPQAAMTAELATGDTLVFTDVALLLPDTTPAVLAEVEVLDTMALALEFDDFLDPEWPTEGVSARLDRPEGSLPPVLEVLHEHEWEERQRARAEAQEPDPDDPDVDPEPDPDDPEEPPAAPEPEVPPEEEPVLPSQVLVLVLGRPALEPGEEYEVTVEGVENINGVPGGGGSVTFSVPELPEEPPPEEPPAEDPSAAPDPDTVPQEPEPPPPDPDTLVSPS